MLDVEYVTKIINGGRSPKVYNPHRVRGVDKPKLLDLYCGGGGATKGYQDAGFFVVGLDIKWQPNYCGDMFIKADAIKWLSENVDFVRDNFQAIHASPPCQAYSIASWTDSRGYHPKLVSTTRDLILETGLPYVIENVVGHGNELIDAKLLCGSSFDLRVRRHRLFETNFEWDAPQCAHEWQDENPIFLIYEYRRWKWRGTAAVYGDGGGKAREYWPWAMGCGSTWDDCWMNTYELSQAIPPAYTNHIGSLIPLPVEVL